MYGIASHSANSIIASTLTLRLSNRRIALPSDQCRVLAHPTAHIGQQQIATALADEHR